eukprot:GHVU01050974.1.p1 GENE.GHVU01050974.1~~GHVU01050974.1.p1  ORF type:complete len:328 (-),score=32.61 GHVU01050974.1:382-1365(-)
MAPQSLTGLLRLQLPTQTHLGVYREVLVKPIVKAANPSLTPADRTVFVFLLDGFLSLSDIRAAFQSFAPVESVGLRSPTEHPGALPTSAPGVTMRHNCHAVDFDDSFLGGPRHCTGGSHLAHVVFREAKGLQQVLACCRSPDGTTGGGLGALPILTQRGGGCVEGYCQWLAAAYVEPKKLMNAVQKYMRRHEAHKKAAMEAASKPQVDADGFVVVTSGHNKAKDGTVVKSAGPARKQAGRFGDELDLERGGAGPAAGNGPTDILSAFGPASAPVRRRKRVGRAVQAAGGDFYTFQRVERKRKGTMAPGLFPTAAKFACSGGFRGIVV